MQPERELFDPYRRLPNGYGVRSIGRIPARGCTMLRTFQRIGSLSVLLMVIVASLAGVRPASAQNNQLCFPGNTGIENCIARFRGYWEQNGGLPIFGYPISPEKRERSADTGTTYTVQWFERNRFEAHPENQPPYNVLLGRLGADRLARLGRNWQAEGRESGPKAGCLWFPETGHNVCDQGTGAGADRGFMSYWLARSLADSRLTPFARSLALHGLPLTEPRIETNGSGNTVLTQWFERARFEWYPNNPAGYRVLLGLLGNEIHGNSPAPRVVKYLWPGTGAQDLAVVPQPYGGSFANETGFKLNLYRPRSTQPDVTIWGGDVVVNPAGQGEPITIRGQSGMSYKTGSGYTLTWRERGWRYMITSNLRLEGALGLAQGLKNIDLPTFRNRIRPR